jgi:hypothetical protein
MNDSDDRIAKKAKLTLANRGSDALDATVGILSSCGERERSTAIHANLGFLLLAAILANIQKQSLIMPKSADGVALDAKRLLPSLTLDPRASDVAVEEESCKAKRMTMTSSIASRSLSLQCLQPVRRESAK